MESIKSQAEVLKRVVGEAQDANLEELSAGLVPAIQQLDGLDAGEEGEEKWIESLEGAVAKCLACFQLHGLSKWMTKIFRKKKHKTNEEKIAAMVRDVGHCATVAQILVLINGQREGEAPGTPCVLWVDDAPKNNLQERQRARDEYGIDFYLATSTEEALQWMKDNENEFKKSNSARFRIVTDWYRPGEKDAAAASLIRNTREQGWNCPLLIYCSEETDTSKVLANEPYTSSSSSDHLLSLFWASMKLTANAVQPKPAKKAAAKRSAKKVAAADEGEEEDAPIALKASKAKSAAAKKAASAIDKTEEEDEDFGVPANAKVPKAKSVGSKKTPSSEESSAPAPVIQAKSPIVAKKAASTKKDSETKIEKPKEEEVVVVEEKPKEELEATMQVDETGVIEPTLPTVSEIPSEEDPTLAKKPTEIIEPPKTASSSIHDILASRVPNGDGEEEEAEFVVVQTPKPKKSGAKKAAKQLFDDDDDDNEDFTDDGEKMDVDDDYEISEEPAKKTISRQSTATVTPAKSPNTISPSVSKKKTDWTSLLASRVPSNGPLSPLASDDAYDHLLATPPVKKATAKKTSKSATVPFTKSPDPTIEATPVKENPSSPLYKPRPPKPTAPMGPTPVKSLSALDDDEYDSDEPLFNKAVAPPSSNNGYGLNSIYPSSCTVFGLNGELQVGTLASFQVEAKTRSNRPVSVGGASVTVNFRSTSGSHEFDGFVEDNKNGTYSVRCFPTRIGTYRATILVEDQHLQGSPYNIDVSALAAKKRPLNPFFEDEDEDIDLQPPTKRSKLQSTLPEEGEEGDGIEATQIV